MAPHHFHADQVVQVIRGKTVYAAPLESETGMSLVHHMFQHEQTGQPRRMKPALNETRNKLYKTV